MERTSETRRDFVKKAAYVAPAILTLPAAPSYAKSGSEKPGKGSKDSKDKKADGKTALNEVRPASDVSPSSPSPTA